MRKRRSKSDWLEASLAVLETEGVDAVTVERLARDLDISRSGFYWHFENRRDLLLRMLEYWLHEYTEIVSGNPAVAALEPKERVLHIMEMVHDFDLGRFDLPIRAWARKDEEARRAVDAVTELRLRVLRSAFREMGYEGAQLEMRTHLFVGYHTWERTMFGKVPANKLRSMRKKRLELLTS